MVPRVLHKLLDLPAVYLTSQFVLGSMRARRISVESYVKPKAGMRILDIGCGPGYVLDYLPKVDYVGYDTDARYISYAQKRYGKRGRFVCGLVTADAPDLGTFDAIMLMGVLHHLDDATALEVMKLAKQVLRPGGRVVSLDGCYQAGQGRVVKALLDIDRGEFIRDEPSYRAIAEQAFDNVQLDIRHDLFLVPYTSAVITCVKPALS